MITPQTNLDQRPAAAVIAEHAADLRVSVDHPRREAALVTVSGSVDTATTTRLRELLHHRLTGCLQVVVLDLSNVTFFNTAGLDMLQHNQQLADQRDVALRIIPDTGRRVMRLLEVLDLSARFPLYTDAAQALNAPVPTAHHEVRNVTTAQ